MFSKSKYKDLTGLDFILAKLNPERATRQSISSSSAPTGDSKNVDIILFLISFTLYSSVVLCRALWCHDPALQMTLKSNECTAVRGATNLQPKAEPMPLYGHARVD